MELEEKFKKIEIEVGGQFDGYIQMDIDSVKQCVETAEEFAVGFAEWITDNQFTKMNYFWTSTKIHYMGVDYTTRGLKNLYKQSLKQSNNG